MQLPVWMYWEGPLPAWIAACQRTVRMHYPDVRLLDRDAFEALREDDHDIDLDRLHVAHRADFVRAYLLTKYGGLWIDSDCIVMQDLAPLFDRILTEGFLGHYERTGDISVAFIGSMPDGDIIREHYRRVCAILRRGHSLSWTEIGGGCLTRVPHDLRIRWHMLPVELIQPICWREPYRFFQQGSDQDHFREFQHYAICYMMSNQMIIGYVRDHPQADLTHPRSFFSYLLRQSHMPSPQFEIIGSPPF